MTFLPALRNKAKAPVLVGQVLPAATGGGLSPRDQERKVILQDYYQHLIAAGGRVGSDPTGRPWNLARAVTEGYERGVWTFKSVETIAGQSSRLPFRLRQGEQTIIDHPLYRVLNHGKANPMETGRQLRKRLSAQVLLSDRGAFVEKTLSRSLDVARLDLLPPARTRPVPGTGQTLIKHYELLGLDGRIEREIDPEKVLWIREPHPTDPYRAVTPLSAAGLSVELDHFARLYNVSFLRHDGRPGGVIAVDGDIDDEDMDRIEGRFGRGPVEAGKLSVIQGEVSYVDLAARPRDMAYAELSKSSKVEILVAFGVPESQLGNAADRTFANADEEAEAFWTITMAAHNDLIVSAFNEDSDEGVEGYLDTSKIEALQRAEIARREEARAELESGAITIDEYRERAGYEVIDMPHTRALYIASSKTPIPTREEDMEALGLAVAVDPAVDPNAQAPVEPPGEQPGGEQPGGGSGGSPVPPGAPTAPAGGGAGGRRASDVLNERRGGPSSAEVPITVTVGTKALPMEPAAQQVVAGRPVLSLVRKAAPARPLLTSPFDEGLVAEVEDSVAEALSILAVAWAERAVARLESPKTRKGTRHWTPEYEVDTRLGTKALDPSRAIDPERWASEAGDATEPILTEGGEVAAEDMVDDLGWQEVVVAAVTAYLAARGMPDGEGDDEWRAMPRLRRLARVATMDVGRMVRDSARRQARALMDLIAGRDRSGATVDEIADDVRAWGVKAGTGWARGLAGHAAGAALEATRAALAEAVAEGPETPPGFRNDITRTWVTKRDERVRDTHDGADTQRRVIGVPFNVGSSLLMYPGDTSAPVSETANCRCRLLYQSTSTGRFVRRPASEGKHLPGRHDQGSHGNRFRSTGPKKRDRELVRQGRARATVEQAGPAPSARDGRGRTVIESDVATTTPEQEAEYRKVLAEIAADFRQPEQDVTPEDLAAWREEWTEEFDPQAEADALAFAVEDDAFMAGWGTEWAERQWGIPDDDEEALAAAARQWGGAEPEPEQPAEPEVPKGPEVPQWLLDENARLDAEREANGGRRVGSTDRQRSPDQQVREDYDLYVHASYLSALEATKGRIYSRAGEQQLDRQERAGYNGPMLDDYDLFRGRLPQKYASEELLEWFSQNGRMTFTQFKAQALGRDSDRRAAQQGRATRYGEN